MSFNGLQYADYMQGFGSRPRLQSTHPFRNLVGAGSHMNHQWSGGSGHSGYGLEPTDYDYHSGPSAHVPSGGSYSYHATTGTAYGPPPPVHAPAKPPAGTGNDGKKGLFGRGGGKGGSSVMSALTLLSFLFFINLLHGCIKDHMDAINPTVMVLTPTVIRNRFNKMGELNSREQSSSYTSNEANIVMQPADLVAAAAVQTAAVVDSTRPLVNVHTAYSNIPTTSYSRPVEQAVVSQATSPYVHNTLEPEVPISYAKPQYDPHKPDAYENIQQSLPYYNHTLVAKPTSFKVPLQEQHYNYHHTEYHAQTPPQPAVPHYGLAHISYQQQQHQHHSVAVKPYDLPYDGTQQDHNAHQTYELAQQQPQSPHYAPEDQHHPWSSDLHTTSVLSEPFRRATIIAVSPKTKWISVPAKIVDRIQLERISENLPDNIEHHEERDVFNKRFS